MTQEMIQSDMLVKTLALSLAKECYKMKLMTREDYRDLLKAMWTNLEEVYLEK